MGVGAGRQDELGITPSNETEALIEAIRNESYEEDVRRKGREEKASSVLTCYL